MIKDTEISRMLNIPVQTISDWKKKDSNRKMLYDFLKSFTKEELEKRVEAIKLLRGMK